MLVGEPGFNVALDLFRQAARVVLHLFGAVSLILTNDELLSKFCVVSANSMNGVRLAPTMASAAALHSLSL